MNGNNLNSKTFVIPGPPKGKGRPRLGRYGNVRTPEGTVVYENWVKTCYLQQIGAVMTPKDREPLKGPVDIFIVCEYAVPKSTSRVKKEAMLAGEILPAKYPDIDNIMKAICDSLNGFAYEDDRQVVSCSVMKKYGPAPQVTVTIQEAGHAI